MTGSHKHRTSKIIDSDALRDVDLVERAVAGDHGARERLALACLPRVRRLVGFAWGNRSDSDDVIQVAMVTVFHDLPSLRDCTRFTGWLDTVVYNVVRSRGRKRTRWNRLFSSSETPRDERSWDVTPEDELSGDALCAAVQKHLDKIAGRKRIAATMSLFFGYVDSEIATMMGCTVETAKKRVQHGRRELILSLKRDPACRDFLKEASR